MPLVLLYPVLASDVRDVLKLVETPFKSRDGWNYYLQ